HIWDVWQHGARPGFEGKYYRFSLMTPFFSPAPLDCPLPQIYIAGVNPYVCRLAGELSDGFHIHPFHSVKYLNETVLPNVEDGLAHHRRDAGGLRGPGHVRRGPRAAQEEVRRGDRPARVLRGGPARGGRRPLAAAHRGVPLIARAQAASAITRAARAARRSPGSAPRRDRPPRAPA